MKSALDGMTVMNGIRRICLSAAALIVLTAGLVVAICPVVNRPWAYDINSDLGVGVISALVSLCVAVALLSFAKPGDASSPTSLVRRSLVTVVCVLALLGAATATWTFLLEDRLTAKRFGVVVPQSIYRSGQISRYMFEPTLDANGIKAVIDLNGLDPADRNQQYEIDTLARRGIDLYRFKLEGDGRGDVEAYVKAVKAMEENRRLGQAVLVHCSAGSQRTGGIIAVYQLLIQRTPTERVMNELRRYGWRPRKDAVLLNYLNDNMSTLARRLCEEGVIERVPEPLPRLTVDAH